MNLSSIAKLLSLPECQSIDIKGFSIDTRKLVPGELFVAISGGQFDGHDFIAQALEKGASAILCSRRMDGLGITQLVVPDTLEALATIASAHKAAMPCRSIALTGSNGKTTVKEMIASVLPSPSLATKGNLNNHIGVPLSLLELKPEHQFAVFELGANHAGEIRHTVQMVKPDVALINNIGPAHLEGFGSIEGVARAKGEIYEGLSPGGIAIVNDDDKYAHFWDDKLVERVVLRYSSQKPSDFSISQLSFDDNECAAFLLNFPDKQKVNVQLRVPGRHNVQNALAAAACCFGVGIDVKLIEQGLNNYSGFQGRMTFLKGQKGSLVIDDTYNANLGSTLTALEVLAKRKGKRIFVFGDMGELGDKTAEHHEAVGQAARQLGIDRLYTYGVHSELAWKAFCGKGSHYKSKALLADKVLDELDADTTVMLKGSRSSAMEEVARALLDVKQDA